MSDEIETEIVARPRDLGGFTVGRVLPAIGRGWSARHVPRSHGAGELEELAVRPHPHINLATVTYLFEGEIVHRDTLGSHQTIAPGAINWMSAGKGIAHSERIAKAARRSRCTACSCGSRCRNVEETERSSSTRPASALPAHVERGGPRPRVVRQRIRRRRRPCVRRRRCSTWTSSSAGRGDRIAGEYAERAAYMVEGAVTSARRGSRPGTWRCEQGREPDLVADGPARLVLLGGEPLDGPRYIWWNFVSSSKERIEAMAQKWRRERGRRFPATSRVHTGARRPAVSGDE